MKEQIAKDKAEREAALKKEKEQTLAATQQQKPTQPAAAAPVKKEYDTCRLQVCILKVNCLFLWSLNRSDYLVVVLSLIHLKPQILWLMLIVTS